MPTSNSEARKKVEQTERTLAPACKECAELRAENRRLRALIPPSTFRRIPRGSGLPLTYSPRRTP